MGFGTPKLMRNGLLGVKRAVARTVGTITLDSYTRTSDHQGAARALRNGNDLNGFPLVVHGPEVTRRMLRGIVDSSFPVQIRHGTALPRAIFETMLAAGLDATEGGPVSYCLPYSRVPLRQAISEWMFCCQLLASTAEIGKINHLESFGGCMLGQLCPPALLVALSVLEGLFFVTHGVRSISLSYAQQTNLNQDIEAVRALRRLAREYLKHVDWHVVIYTYMGVYPRTRLGAAGLLEESIRLAVITRAERLIVKTPVEAFRLPTVEENVATLEFAAETVAACAGLATHLQPEASEWDSEIYAAARTLVEAVLDLATPIGEALALAFEKGYLDVPYCVHPDNKNRSRSCLDDDGFLRWAQTGSMPLPRDMASRQIGTIGITSRQLLSMLTYNRRRFDGGRDPAVEAERRGL
jgi:methylaspartate mutase epsilon subunit